MNLGQKIASLRKKNNLSQEELAEIAKRDGLVAEKEKIESRNVLGLVNKIEKYIEFLRTNDEFVTKFYDIGDGLSVSFRKSDENVKNID